MGVGLETHLEFGEGGGAVVIPVPPASRTCGTPDRLRSSMQGSGRLWVNAPTYKLRSLFGRTPSIEVTVELPSDSRVGLGGRAR